MRQVVLYIMLTLVENGWEVVNPQAIMTPWSRMCDSVSTHFSVLSSLQPLIIEYPSSKGLGCALDLHSHV